MRVLFVVFILSLILAVASAGTANQYLDAKCSGTPFGSVSFNGAANTSSCVSDTYLDATTNKNVTEWVQIVCLNGVGNATGTAVVSYFGEDAKAVNCVGAAVATYVVNQKTCTSTALLGYVSIDCSSSSALIASFTSLIAAFFFAFSSSKSL